MSESKIIKSVTEGICPHCSKPIMISLRSYMPVIDWTLKKEDLAASKKKLTEEVKLLKFKNDSAKIEIIEWLKGEEVMIGPEEVSVVLSQIIKDNVNSDDSS